MTGFKVGDRGQRYEVRAIYGEDKKIILGWADNDEGVQSFLKSIELHPSMHSPEVIDRNEIKKEAENGN